MPIPRLAAPIAVRLRPFRGGLILMLLGGLGCTSRPTSGAPATSPSPIAATCEGSAHPFTRWTLFFGMSRPRGGAVTDSEWEAFLRDEITPRFPNGFTVMEGEGRWRGAEGTIVRERTRMVVLIQPDTRGIRFAVSEIVSRYKTMFQQESVLEELTPVCAAF